MHLVESRLHFPQHTSDPPSADYPKLPVHHTSEMIAEDKEKNSKAQRPVRETESHFGDWPNTGAFQTTWEQKEPVELSVKGKIPAEVAGVLYRTGPAHFKVTDSPRGDVCMHHWFDGFSAVYRFELIADGDNCRVLFSSRQQVDKLIENIRKTGNLDQITFAQKRDPCVGFFQKLKAGFIPRHVDDDPQVRNVGVTIHAEQKPDSKRHLVARTDAAVTKQIDIDTLEPVGVTEQSSLHPSLTGPLSAAHAQIDPKTGDFFNYNLCFGYAPKYRVFRHSPSTGETEILATIAGHDAKPAYIHSFFLTEDLVILCVFVSHFRGRGAAILWERNILDAIAPFKPHAKTMWYAIDRRHGRGVVAKYTSDAMFAFHSVNAFQEAQQLPSSSSSTSSTEDDESSSVDVLCDIIEFPSLDVLHRLYYDNLISTGPGAHLYSGKDINRSSFTPRLRRYRLADIPLPSADVSLDHDTTDHPGIPDTEPAVPITEIPSPAIGELPTMNPSYRTKRARYVYTLVDHGLSSYVDSIAKTDIETGQAVYWEDRERKCTPGEVIFVAKPTAHARDGVEGGAEDDGYLLSVVLDGETQTSFLLCLDARSMAEVGRASVEGPVGVGFHGCHAKAS